MPRGQTALANTREIELRCLERRSSFDLQSAEGALRVKEQDNVAGFGLRIRHLKNVAGVRGENHLVELHDSAAAREWRRADLHRRQIDGGLPARHGGARAENSFDPVAREHAMHADSVFHEEIEQLPFLAAVGLEIQ
jgi:hypothetical protein